MHVTNLQYKGELKNWISVSELMKRRDASMRVDSVDIEGNGYWIINNSSTSIRFIITDQKPGQDQYDDLKDDGTIFAAGDVIRYKPKNNSILYIKGSNINLSIDMD